MNDVLMKADLQDLASPKLEKLKKNVGDVSNGSNILKGAFGDLTNKAESMGVPLGKMGTYFGALSPVMLGSVAAIGAVAAGVAVLTMRAVQVGADLQDMADTTGLTVEALSSMRNVLAASNMDTKGYADAVSKLSIKLGENGEAFKKLGIDTQDPEKAFDQIKHKIGDMTSPIEKAKFANMAFGKSFKDLMPLLTMSNDEYDKMKGNTSVFSTEFAQNAALIDDKLSVLKTSFGDLGTKIGSVFLPALAGMLDLVGRIVEGVNTLAAEDKHAYQTKGLQVKQNIGGRVGTANLNETNINSEDAQNQLKGLNSQQILDLATWANIEQNNKALAFMLVKMSKAKKEQEAEIAKKEEADRLEKLKASGLDFGDKPKGRDKKLDKYLGQSYGMDDLHADSSYGGNGSWEAQVKRSNEFKAKGKQNQLNRMGQLQDEAASLNLTVSMFDDENSLIKKIKDAKKATEDLKKSTEDYKRIAESLSGTVSGALVQPFDAFFKRVGSGNKSMGDSFKGLFSDIGDNFGNMLTSMMAQMLQKAAIFGMLNLISGGIFGGAAAGGAAAGLKSFSWFSGGTDYAYSGIARVGERGPETVVLPRGSKVIPNDNQNNGSNVINVNVNGSTMTPRQVSNTVVSSLKTYVKMNEYRRAS